MRAAWDWRKKKVKLTEAKKIILDCHAAARDVEGNPVAQAAARALAQSASIIHVARHCIGLLCTEGRGRL